MKVLVAYIAVCGGPKTADFLSRFRLTFDFHPPSYPCEIMVVCNGGPLPTEDALWMRQEWKCYPRKNEGADLGAYFDVVRTFDCDMLVCFGESVFFHRKDWLVPLVKAWEKEPYGMYGCYASNLVTKHLNTTAFAIDPRLLKHCGVPKNREERHAWEHGHHPFWRTVSNLGRPVRLVTFDGCYDPTDWRIAPNGLWSGDQSACLVHCIHTTRYAEASETTKRRWTANADGGAR